MSDIDNIINQKVCHFYPGDPNNCIKDLPMFKIKLIGSILLIIIGILIFRKSNGLIVKFISSILNKFAKLIGITLIVVGLLILNKVVDKLI